MADQIFTRRWSVWMADTVLEKFPELKEKWSYDYGVICKGLEYIYEETKDERYFNYIKETMDYFVDNDGNIRYYNMADHNIDYVNNGKALLFLYKKTSLEKYRKAADVLRAQLKEHPRTSEGGFWHKDIYPHQMWLDGLYMAEPFYAQYINMFDDKNDFSDVLLQFKLIDKYLKDKNTKLLYHGWDESKTCFWANPKTGLSANFWGRSVGWFSCALIDTLDFVSTPAEKQILIEQVKSLAEGLISVQSPKNWLWYQVLDKQDELNNYPEASCSCMFTYFLFKAVAKGYIDESYIAHAQKAFRGILHEFVEIDAKTLINLKGTVFVSGLGGGLFRDGTYEYYVSEPRQTNNLLGIGAFMMAAIEYEKTLVRQIENASKNKK